MNFDILRKSDKTVDRFAKRALKCVLHDNNNKRKENPMDNADPEALREEDEQRAPVRKMLTPTKMAKMQAAMQKKPLSLSALAELSGLDKRVVTRYVRELQAGDLVHVGGWDRDARGYPTIERYRWGKGQNVACPKKYDSEAERMRLVRASKKKKAGK